MRLNAVVVEDNAVFRQELREYLEAFAGIELIDSFRNGEEFLVQLARLKPDVVLLDIGMPGRSGIEIAAVLRQERPTVEIIFITSFEEHIKDGVRLYAADYITKPLDTKRLDETLCRILTKFPRIEKRVELKVGRDMEIVEESSIYLVEASSKKSIVYTKSGQLTCNHTISEMEDLLDKNLFFKSGRSYLVNLKMVRNVKAVSRTSFEILFQDRDIKALMPKAQYENFRRQFKRLTALKGVN